MQVPVRTFGEPKPGVCYEERRAAYVVVLSPSGHFGAVGSGAARFLPGGGCRPGETPQETVFREVREELGCGVRIQLQIGRAVQYFSVPAEGKHYRMSATFYLAELTEESHGLGEHELEWLPVSEAEATLFHACHAWAVYLPTVNVAAATSNPGVR